MPRGRFRKYMVMCHFRNGSRPMPVSSGYPLFVRWTKEDTAPFVELVWTGATGAKVT